MLLLALFSTQPSGASEREPALSVWPIPDSSTPSDEPKKPASEGVLGPLRIGPVVGTGLPSLLSVGGTLKLTRYFGAGVNVGVIPEVRVAYYGDATLSYREYDVYGRIFPFGGDFFIGTGVGYARAEGTLARNFQSAETGLPDAVAFDSRGSVQTLVLTPQLGYFHVFGSGFTIGVDVGAQIPLAPSDIEFDWRLSETVPSRLAEPYVAPNEQRVRDTLEAIGRTPLPTVNFRIGWML